VQQIKNLVHNVLKVVVKELLKIVNDTYYNQSQFTVLSTAQKLLLPGYQGQPENFS
jgi:hypothetical protein